MADNEQQNPTDTDETTTTETTETGGGGGETLTMTQAEYDFNVEKRVARLKKNYEQELRQQILSELGVESVDTAKEKLKAVKEREDAEKSEVVRLQEAQLAEANRVKALEAELESKQKAWQQERLDNAIKDAVKDAEAINADQVVILLKAGELDKIVDDDGNPVTKKIAALVTKHKDENQHLYKPKRTSPGSPSNSDGQSGSKKMDKQKAFINQTKVVRNRGL